MITEFVETMQAQLEEAGVDVRLGVKADLAAIKATGAEAVFMAAGGRPVLPSIPGIEGAVTAEEILGRETPPADQNIVIIGGGVTGLETAEYLSEKNKVTVVEMLDKVGGNLYPSVVMHLAQEIMKNGGAILKGKKLTAVEDGAVTIADAKTGDETSLPADLVVLAMGIRPDRPDYDALREAYGDKLILVGDSGRPGQIYDALHSGHDKAFVY
jgi:pyruvate/2-oxoglutarate dehydrogenase complex dihydrolipoamide dehydrogenase (E3) component